MTDTKNILIAQRYSQALSDMAKEGVLSYEQINDNLTRISDILNSSNDLKEFLINPLVSADDKKDVLNQIFSNETDSVILNFLKVLIDKKRFDAFDEIVLSYRTDLDKINNISRVKVVSAVEMTVEEKDRLIAKLSQKMNKQVILETEVDEEILAGLVIKIGDNVIDTSLRHKLDELEKSIMK